MADRNLKQNQRKSFARIPPVMEMPNLIETQLRSYREFLWKDNTPWDRPIRDLRGDLLRKIREWIMGQPLAKNATNPWIRRVIVEKGTVVDESVWEKLTELPLRAIHTSDSDKELPAMVEALNKPGLQGAFESIFPIKKEDTELVFDGFTLGRPKYSIGECVDRGMTYAAPLRIKVRLVISEKGEDSSTKIEKEIREEEIYIGEIPLITPKGTFVVNGAERVVVSQLHRSPGPVFDVEQHVSGRTIVKGQIIPSRGAWLEFESDLNNVISVVIDRRNKKIPVTTLLRAFGLEENQAILEKFCSFKEISLKTKKQQKEAVGHILVTDIIDEATGEVKQSSGHALDAHAIDELVGWGVSSIRVLDSDPTAYHAIVETLKRDPATDSEAAYMEIFNILRPNETFTNRNANAAKTLIENLFWKPRRYDLSRVGRYRMNRKLNINVRMDEVVLTLDDIYGVFNYMLRLLSGNDINAQPDDIDHLGNRRVRTIGELLENQIRTGLARMERAIREKMGVLEIKNDSSNIMPRNLVNSKPIMSAITEFFGRSQLSQFLDQINPLAELTHKRRLSALGPGGLNRERAGFEVRDVHHTHYGRVCPIETPEGPNIGLIASLSSFARINDVGFIETPYRRVNRADKQVTKDIVHLEALDEDLCVIAQANAPLDENGVFTKDSISVRSRGEFTKMAPQEIHYMDVSPNQLVSISASLIPFLEHDDANRALMGSNMQRQAVPLLRAQAPLIGTGIESKAAQDSGIVVRARRAGKVIRVTADQIDIKPDAKSLSNYWINLDEYDFSSTQANDFLKGIDVYRLSKYIRSNQNTMVNQKPVVRVGDRVVEGSVLADGPATDRGELALGRNVLVAFMSWEGYNYEDSILVSERMIRDHVFTSIHIEEAKVEARDTKLGEEEITRDIPNVGEESLSDLDENGIIRIGAEVKPGDILVGKISPKGKVQTSNVEKLLRAIFGKRAEDVRDISLKASPGTYGTVVDVKVFSRKSRQGASRQEEEQVIKRLDKERKSMSDRLNEQWETAIRELITGALLQEDLLDLDGKLLLAAGTTLDDAQIKKLSKTHLADVDIPVENKDDLTRLNRQFHARLEEIDQEYQKQVDYIRTGDNLPAGVIKMVKVYIAKKKKLAVGDKMAGRHGNKGVISRVLPMEDMPHLEDGTPVDIVLNPLGVPSRMNIGQVLETHLGWAANALGKAIETPVFDGAREREIRGEMRLAESLMLTADLLEQGQPQLSRAAVRAGALALEAMGVIRDEILHEKESEFDLVYAQSSGLLQILKESNQMFKRFASLAAAISYLEDTPDVQKDLGRRTLAAVQDNASETLQHLQSLAATWGDFAESSQVKELTKFAAGLTSKVEDLQSMLENLDSLESANKLKDECKKLLDQMDKHLPMPGDQDFDLILGQDGEPTSQEVRKVELRELLRLIQKEEYSKASVYSQHHGLACTAVPADIQKVRLIDGKTGDYFERNTTVGFIYMMKLNHLVDDKIHARAIGPYSLVTQQPLGGKAQFGGQRLGEMEVWALEAYGAANILQELLTVKSDDTVGRNRIYESIVKGEDAKPPGLPESFYVLIKEIESLALSIELKESDNSQSVQPVQAESVAPEIDKIIPSSVPTTEYIPEASPD